MRKKKINRNVGNLVISATTFMSYEMDVEVIKWKKPIEFAEYLESCTKEVFRFDDTLQQTEFDFIQKYFQSLLNSSFFIMLLSLFLHKYC